MSEALAKYDAGFKFTQEQIDVIKSQIAKGATNDELSMFTMIAQKYGLDPFLKEIWFIKRAKKRKDPKTGEWDYKRLPSGEIDYIGAETLIMTSRDGYLKVAQRDPNFAGIISFVVREGDVFEIDAENYKVTHKFGSKRGPILGAWSKVDHKGRKPVITFVDFKEYHDDKSTTWKQYPSAMIQKVAEVFSLKRQFGISGLVTREEIASQIKEDEFENTIEVMAIESHEVEPGAAVEEIPVCFDCSKIIKSTEKTDAKTVIDYSLEHYNRILCADCQKELAGAIKAIHINNIGIKKHLDAYSVGDYKQELQTIFKKNSSTKLTVAEAKQYIKHQVEIIAQLQNGGKK